MQKFPSKVLWRLVISVLFLLAYVTFILITMILMTIYFKPKAKTNHLNWIFEKILMFHFQKVFRKFVLDFILVY